MPIYEYTCPNEQCGEAIEKLRKVSEKDDPLECPQCHSHMRKKVSVSSFLLKGGGWASDGYGG